MSLNLVPSKSHVGHPDLVVSGQWIQTIQETPDLVLEYRHTVRKVPVLVDCSDPRSDRDLLDETQNEDGQVVYTFAGEELLWNNKWRRHVIEEGLDKFVPQVLYLVRICLHFMPPFLGKAIGRHGNLRRSKEFHLQKPRHARLDGTLLGTLPENLLVWGVQPWHR